MVICASSCSTPFLFVPHHFSVRDRVVSDPHWGFRYLRCAHGPSDPHRDGAYDYHFPLLPRSRVVWAHFSQKVPLVACLLFWRVCPVKSAKASEQKNAKRMSLMTMMSDDGPFSCFLFGASPQISMKMRSLRSEMPHLTMRRRKIRPCPFCHAFSSSPSEASLAQLISCATRCHSRTTLRSCWLIWGAAAPS